MRFFKPIIIFAMLLLATSGAWAQRGVIVGKNQFLNNDQTYDSTRFSPHIFFEADGTLFIRDNEFDSPQMRGYTIPGFNFEPRLVYRPYSNIRVEAGVHMLRFWGANLYPDAVYMGIPNYNMDNATQGLHIVPMMQIEMATRNGWRFILGSVNNYDQHGLLRQLYAAEYMYTADPESGAQILYKNKWFDMDLWVDWRKFIYWNSPYQENFLVGLSSLIKYNNPEKKVHVYSPIQALVEHRGGEIDTIYTSSVQTFINTAVGLGTTFDVGRRTRLKVEADILASIQQAGHTWFDRNGIAEYVYTSLELPNCIYTLGFFNSHKFNTILGYPLWGSTSTRTHDMVITDHKIVHFTIKYNKEFMPGFWLGARLNLYETFGYKGVDPESDFGSKFNFSIQATMTMYPSWLIWREKHSTGKKVNI